MNHIYRIVFNRKLGVLQAVSECAHARGKSGRSAVRRGVKSSEVISAFALAAVLTTTGIALPHVAHAAFITTGGGAGGGVSMQDGTGVGVSGGSGGIGGGGGGGVIGVLLGIQAQSPGHAGGDATGGVGGTAVQTTGGSGGALGAYCRLAPGEPLTCLALMAGQESCQGIVSPGEVAAELA